MDAAPLSEDEAHALAAFPEALRRLVQAELAAGNGIVEVGSGHPAPPAGARVVLRDPFRTAAHLPEGLSLYVRNSSTHHQEVTDVRGFHWVLTAPLPPPAPPDMDAIREAASTPTRPITPTIAAPRAGSITMDIRGELLILTEADRRCEIIWTWNRGNRLYRSSLCDWWYPVERRFGP